MKQIHRSDKLGFYLIILLLIFFSSCAVTSYKIEKISLDKHFQLNSVFQESHTGMMVYDPESEEVLFNYNAQKHFTPASNTKLLTYFAIIHTLTDSIASMKSPLGI